jgi:hypothetical protein
MRGVQARGDITNNTIYCFGLGEAFAAGDGEADAPFRASLRS